MSGVVRVGVGCFVTKQTERGVKILIGKRKGSHGSGAWQLPGGHLEVNENFEECARREVLEETNLQLDQIDFITATNDIMESEGKHYVTIFMAGRAKDPAQLRVMEPEKLDGSWQWVAYNDLVQFKPLFTPLKHFIELPDNRKAAMVQVLSDQK
ncbi:hypothetical protein VTP01DRAFT_6010 [Rhizomucor pusillus]|uniref:uncharacterized protein n=1 Tax=Rhizomucor pusillus TaxID=4840 RepID=UPI003743F3A6